MHETTNFLEDDVGGEVTPPVAKARSYNTFLVSSGGMFMTLAGTFGGPGRADVAIYPTEASAARAKEPTHHIVRSSVFWLDNRKPNVPE